MSFHPDVNYQAPHESQRELREEVAFAFTPENRQRLERIATHYPPEHRRSAIIPALYLAQEQQGFISADAVREVAAAIGCTPADVDEVVTYYAMFFRHPVGKYVVQVCRTLSCALRGAERVSEEIGRQLGIGVGETDASGTFTLMEMECLGACDRAPVVMVNNRYWQECQSPDDVRQLLEGLRTKGPEALTGCHLKTEGKPGPAKSDGRGSG